MQLEAAGCCTARPLWDADEYTTGSPRFFALAGKRGMKALVWKTASDASGFAEGNGRGAGKHRGAAAHDDFWTRACQNGGCVAHSARANVHRMSDDWLYCAKTSVAETPQAQVGSSLTTQGSLPRGGTARGLLRSTRRFGVSGPTFVTRTTSRVAEAGYRMVDPQGSACRRALGRAQRSESGGSEGGVDGGLY